MSWSTAPKLHAAMNDIEQYISQSPEEVQFPLDQPMPYELIRRMVAYRVTENSGKK